MIIAYLNSEHIGSEWLAQSRVVQDEHIVDEG